MIGKFIQQTEDYKAFIPNAFPPEGLEITNKTFLMNDVATLALGRLDGIAQTIPNVEFFALMSAIKEASLSSNIEGTMATMNDYIQANIGVEKNIPKDVIDIACYNQALKHGLDQLTDLPIASRLIKEIHRILIPDKEKQSKTAGDFRQSQNWIGGTNLSNAAYVPPPPTEINRCLKDLDNFINQNRSYPTLINVALAHAQFETIHPFIDGNGRIGRILITLQLVATQTLGKPVLCLSEYLKRYRQVYFDQLIDYHTKNDVNGWLQFFLKGVKQIADQSSQVATKLVQLRDQDLERVATLDGKQSSSANKLLRGLYKQPIVDVAQIARITGLSRQAAYSLANRFIGLGILTKFKPKGANNSRPISYQHHDYLDVFGAEQ